MTRQYKTINDWSGDFSDAFQTFKKTNKILLDKDEAFKIFERESVAAIVKKQNTKALADKLWKSGIFVFPDDISCDEASIHNLAFFMNKNGQMQRINASWHPVVDEMVEAKTIIETVMENKTCQK